MMSFWRRIFGKKVHSPHPQAMRQDGVPPKAMRQEGAPPTEGAMTLGVDFSEAREERRWEDIPDASAIPAAWRAGSKAEALRLARALQQREPDYYFGYYQEAVVLTLPPADYEKAFDALRRGIQSSQSKAALCETLGRVGVGKRGSEHRRRLVDQERSVPGDDPRLESLRSVLTPCLCS